MNLKNNKGITLIALVITIIVLLILAGISITMISGDDGIISRASNAAEQTKEKSKAEGEKLSEAEDYITDKINQANGSSASDPSLSHSGTLPEGAFYGNYYTASVYEEMPETVSDGDVYLYEDYLYLYSAEDSGWNVVLATSDLGLSEYVPEFEWVDKNQTSYGPILEQINNEPITVADNTFIECVNLVELPKIPDTVFSMRATFANCTSITDVSDFKFPSQLDNLEAAFAGCSSLTNEGMPVLPYGVTDLLSTFARCTSLTDISNFKMPDSVISLDSTFYDCTSLTNIGNLYISKSATNLWHTFNGCTALVDVSNFTIPSHVTELYGTFANCTSLKVTPTIPNTVIEMSTTFQNCTSLVNAPTIPDSVIELSYAFKDCTSLINAPEIPNSVTKMVATFMNCTSMVKGPDVISENVYALQETFCNCTSLTGNIEINSIQTSHYYSGCFSGVDFAAQNLTITGTSNYLNKIIQTGTNY